MRNIYSKKGCTESLVGLEVIFMLINVTKIRMIESLLEALSLIRL